MTSDPPLLSVYFQDYLDKSEKFRKDNLIYHFRNRGKNNKERSELVFKINNHEARLESEFIDNLSKDIHIKKITKRELKQFLSQAEKLEERLSLNSNFLISVICLIPVTAIFVNFWIDYGNVWINFENISNTVFLTKMFVAFIFMCLSYSNFDNGSKTKNLVVDYKCFCNIIQKVLVSFP